MKRRILLFLSLVFLTPFCVLAQQTYATKFKEGCFLFLEENYPMALQQFLSAYKLDSANSNINYKIGITYLKLPSDKIKAIPYLEKAVKHVSPNYKDFEAYEKSAPVNAHYFLAQSYHAAHRFGEAVTEYSNYLKFVSEKQKDLRDEVSKQLEICKNAQEYIANPVNVIITNFGDSINTIYPEYSPLISADETVLIFTSRRDGSTGGERTTSNEFFEDIYISYKNDQGVWSKAKSIGANINSAGHEAAIGFSADGQKLFLFKDDDGDGNIYYSNLENDKWLTPAKLGSDINSKGWEPSASLSADGNTLYFVSDRKGGFGGRDIWKCVKLPNGEWSLATNLGPVINTPDDEEAPFIHPDGRTLFFSSNGHRTMGGFDIFSAYKNNEGFWTEPQNVGYPINTTDDDLFYVLSPNGKRAYYASAKVGGKGDKDIYLINFPDAEEKPLTLIRGTIIPEEGKPLPDVRIVVTNNETGENIGTFKPIRRNGSFTLIIPPGSNYKLVFYSDETAFHTEDIYVPIDAAYQEIEKEVFLKPVSINGKEVSTTEKVVKVGKTPSEIALPSREKELVGKDEPTTEVVPTTPVTAKETNAPVKEPKVPVAAKEVKSQVPANVTEPATVEKTAVSQPGRTQPKIEGEAIPSYVRHKGKVWTYKMFFGYNKIALDPSEAELKEFVEHIYELYKESGAVHLVIRSSASMVPTRLFGGNRGLAKERGRKAKELMEQLLKEKGLDMEKVKITVKAEVNGPIYNSDYLVNKKAYEKFQFIKMRTK